MERRLKAGKFQRIKHVVPQRLKRTIGNLISQGIEQVSEEDFSVQDIEEGSFMFPVDFVFTVKRS
jgi:hypothetical protein